IQNAVKKTGVTVYPLKTGLATEGVDLGGPSASDSAPARIVALLVGEGVNNNDAGEIWHLLDQRYDVPCVLLDQANLRNNLSSYTHIVLVDGNYSSSVASKLKDFAGGGGTLIAFGRATKFLKINELAHFELKQPKENKAESKRRPYSNLENDEGAQVIGGAIFEAEADLTHPLLFGFRESKIPVFRGDTIFMQPTRNAYATPLTYTANPLLSGYLSQKNKELAKNAASIVVSSANGGRSICMIDNPAFRAFWFGTNKLFANMIFFSNLIQSNALEQPKKE
ncbi:MAG: zinc carboxypeptidase, partial [Saprospiraceae bacterium]|nr:zinc carboxypeptidase [Saprospiraceae bacterium]